jgi:hypothetical protein
MIYSPGLPGLFYCPQTEKVEKEIASVKRGHPMTFDEADNGNTNPHYAVHSAASANCPACVLSMKARLEGGVMYKQDHMMKKAT